MMLASRLSRGTSTLACGIARKDGLFVLLSASLLLCDIAAAAEETMIDFTHPKEYKQWRAVNDNVMGGVSEGKLTFDGNHSRFEGTLSLANNGGFSSINRILKQPMGKTSVKLTYIGDGRTYQIRFATQINGAKVNYKHEFSTAKGTQQSKEFKLEDFQAVFRGRLISGAPTLRAQDIQQLGFLIADKKSGEFTLKLIELSYTGN